MALLVSKDEAARLPCLLLLITLLAATFSSITEARMKSSRWEDLSAGRTPGDVILAVVALAQQKITLYDATGPVRRASISTGRDDYETPAGVFSVLQKEEEHYSNRYDDAAMPFMQRITWSGIALHAGPLPGYPASHGCIRLPYKFAQQIFGMTKLGLRVVIVPGEVAPKPLSHALLSTLLPTLDAPMLQPAGADAEQTLPNSARDQVIRLQSIATAAREHAARAGAIADEANSLVRAKAPDQKRAIRLLLAVEKANSRAEKQLSGAERNLSSAKTPEQVSKARTRINVARRELEKATRTLETSAVRCSPRSKVQNRRARQQTTLQLPRTSPRSRRASRDANCGPSRSLLAVGPGDFTFVRGSSQ